MFFLVAPKKVGIPALQANLHRLDDVLQVQGSGGYHGEMTMIYMKDPTSTVLILDHF